MRVKTRHISHIGFGHTVNEDSRFVAEDLIVVADGMGGEVDGDIASRIAVDTIVGCVTHTCDSLDLREKLEDNLNTAILKADEQIRVYGALHPHSKGMGTTALVAVPYKDVLTLAWCGDCRCFRFRKGELSSVTKDHSYVQELVDAGSLKPGDVFGHPDSNVITRFVGGGIGVCIPENTRCDLCPGDIFILCSDGLSGYVRPEKIKECIAECRDFDVLSTKLLQLALRYGSEDDITVVTLKVMGDEDTSSHDSRWCGGIIRCVKTLLHIGH